MAGEVSASKFGEEVAWHCPIVSYRFLHFFVQTPHHPVGSLGALYSSDDVEALWVSYEVSPSSTHYRECIAEAGVP